MIRFCLYDSSVLDASHERVLVEGMDLKRFEKNPIMLYNHRTWSNLPIGYWENITKSDGKLFADAVFDSGDDFAMEIERKIENGIIRTASIGFAAIAYSDDPEDMLAGQKRSTVTKSELYEVSIVPIPDNPNATVQKEAHKNEKGISKKTFSYISLQTKNNPKPMSLVEKLEKAFSGLFKKEDKSVIAEASKSIAQIVKEYIASNENQESNFDIDAIAEKAAVLVTVPKPDVSEFATKSEIEFFAKNTDLETLESKINVLLEKKLKETNEAIENSINPLIAEIATIKAGKGVSSKTPVIKKETSPIDKGGKSTVSSFGGVSLSNMGIKRN